MRQLWRGVPVDSTDGLWDSLDSEIDSTLRGRLRTSDVLDACERISQRILSGDTARYEEALREDGSPDPAPVLAALAENLSRRALTRKLVAELGTEAPMDLSRPVLSEQCYEAWRPVGVVVHITAGNSPIVAPMATVEGLLTGNINIVKCASNMGAFASAVLADMCDGTPLVDFVYLLRVSSKDTERMRFILDRADCVSVWGGEEATRAVRDMTPQGTRFVSWGHRISFAYLVPDSVTPESMRLLAASVCRNEQQSCSSPQCVLVDTDDPEEVRNVARMLAEALDDVGPRFPRVMPDEAQAAEIASVTQVHRCDCFFSGGGIIGGPGDPYRILICDRTKFMPSPLFRTVWLSPLSRTDLVPTLRGMRGYLQTAGLACRQSDLAELSDILYSAGVDRITPLDSMSASYSGEPHDGGYALPRFMRRVSLRTDLPMHGVLSMSQMEEPEDIHVSGPIQGKADYPPVPDEGTRVLMKSGGTTGDPVYCSYTQRDFDNYIVRPAVKALIAAGLDPENDVLADFLKSGNLYGGLNSFISITDAMSAKHLSIGGLDDVRLAAEYLVRGRATAVLGAPSYIIRLFTQNHDLMKGYGRVRKVFFGGEMMTEGQMAYLREEFGVEVIRGVLYGANETGTMGYQCDECGHNVYHLCADIQRLEIVRQDSDEPVGEGEAGRMLFTGFLRENGRTERYDIGDLGRWVPGECPCGKREPRFELLGRHGDVVRIGGTFFNYHRIAAVLAHRFGYSGLMQIVLGTDGLTETMSIRVQETEASTEGALDVLVEEYDSFAKVVPTGLVRVTVDRIPDSDFIINDKSVKLRTIVDGRER